MHGWKNLHLLALQAGPYLHAGKSWPSLQPLTSQTVPNLHHLERTMAAFLRFPGPKNWLPPGV